MSRQLDPALDRGSIALELLVFGILTPVLIVAFALTALAGQRTGLQANQIARQTVRLAASQNLTAEALGHLSNAQEAQVQLGYGLAPADISISLARKDFEIGALYQVTVRLRDHVEAAKMLGAR